MPPEETPNATTPVGAEATEQWPIRIERAAELLHWKPRALKAHLRRLASQGVPCGRRAGKTVIFSKDDFDRLYASLPGNAVRGASTDDQRSPSFEEHVRVELEEIKAAIAQVYRAVRARPGLRAGPRNYLKGDSRKSVVTAFKPKGR